MSEKRIVRRALQDRQRGRTDWARVDQMSEAEIEAAALADPDNPPWSDEELADARLVLPSEAGKERITMYLDRDVLRYFRRQGRGYESRINAVLRAYVGSREQR